MKRRSAISRFGLIANPAKPACRKLVQRAASIITAMQAEVLADAATAQLGSLEVRTFPDAASLAQACDLLMVFGGDGTMLRVARETASASTPIIGINAGALGFLTDVPAHQLAVALEQISRAEAALETRPMIEASVPTAQGVVLLHALNDFVISRMASPRLIEVEVKVDGESLTRYRCDGFIVASPTGSTAYSLAAGGAIVSPSADVFTLTPICPHTLSNRSVIVSLRSVVQMISRSERVETQLSADGQQTVLLRSDDVVTIRRSRHSVRLLHLAASSFFETLRLKLNWGGSHVR